MFCLQTGGHSGPCVRLQSTGGEGQLHGRLVVRFHSVNKHFIVFFCHKTILCVASKQLQVVALDLVKESFGDSHYNKAVDCIKALRQETITVCRVI